MGILPLIKSLSHSLLEGGEHDGEVTPLTCLSYGLLNIGGHAQRHDLQLEEQWIL